MCYFWCSCSHTCLWSWLIWTETPLMPVCTALSNFSHISHYEFSAKSLEANPLGFHSQCHALVQARWVGLTPALPKVLSLTDTPSVWWSTDCGCWQLGTSLCTGVVLCVHLQQSKFKVLINMRNFVLTIFIIVSAHHGVFRKRSGMGDRKWYSERVKDGSESCLHHIWKFPIMKVSMLGPCLTASVISGWWILIKRLQGCTNGLALESGYQLYISIVIC